MEGSFQVSPALSTSFHWGKHGRSWRGSGEGCVESHRKCMIWWRVIETQKPTIQGPRRCRSLLAVGSWGCCLRMKRPRSDEVCWSCALIRKPRQAAALGWRLAGCLIRSGLSPVRCLQLQLAEFSALACSVWSSRFPRLGVASEACHLATVARKVYVPLICALSVLRTGLACFSVVFAGSHSRYPKSDAGAGACFLVAQSLAPYIGVRRIATLRLVVLALALLLGCRTRASAPSRSAMAAGVLQDRLAWDGSSFDRFRILRGVSPEDPLSPEVIYCVIPVPVISNREMLQYRWQLKLPNDGWVMMMRSFEDDALQPPDPRLTRAFTHLSGYLLRPVDGALELTAISRVDFGGNIPTFVQNQMRKGTVKKTIEWASRLQAHCRQPRGRQAHKEVARAG